MPPIELQKEAPAGHGQNADGSVACCRRLSVTILVDCVTCLEEEWASLSDSLDRQEKELAMHALAIVQEAGEQGITKGHLRVRRLHISHLKGDFILGSSDKIGYGRTSDS